MPLETLGWIEYSPYFTQEERDDEHSWSTWMRIDAVIYRVDEVTEILYCVAPAQAGFEDQTFKLCSLSLFRKSSCMREMVPIRSSFIALTSFLFIPGG
jgi:hypothetical protein